MPANLIGEMMFPRKSDSGIPDQRRYRMSGSRKRALLWSTVVLAILVAAAVVLPVLVSGKTTPETGKAQELMKRSDEKLVSLRPKGERINSSVGVMVPDIAYLTSAQYAMTKGNIIDLIEETRSDLKEVRQGYAEILDLNGVDEYIRYARVKLGLVHVDFEQLEVIEDLLDYLTVALAERDAGNPLDSQGISDATNATVAKMKELSTQVEELTTQAAQIKKEETL